MKTLPNEPITAITGIGVNLCDGGKRLEFPLNQQDAGLIGNFPGLTKLEYAAIQAMKGILANGSDYYNKRNNRAHFIAEVSVTYAKALFDELNKEQ